MKNRSRHFGYLRILGRLPNSKNGNPRYNVFVADKAGTGFGCRTKPDDMLAYQLPNYEGKAVEAIIGTHYGVATLESLKLAENDQ